MLKLKTDHHKCISYNNKNLFKKALTVFAVSLLIKRAPIVALSLFHLTNVSLALTFAEASTTHCST